MKQITADMNDMELLKERDELTVSYLAMATKILVTQTQSQGITEEEINKWNLYCNEEDHYCKFRSRLDNPRTDNLQLTYLSRHYAITELLIQRQHEELYHYNRSCCQKWERIL